MNTQSILQAVESVLRDQMANQHMADFSPQARLNEDLHLDSVQVLNLLLHLETRHGFYVPEETLGRDSFETVEGLALFITGEPAAAEAPDDAEIDIKVHCFVSCLSAAIKASDGLDHRPFYFGVWDTDFHVDDKARLTYHAPSVKHDHFRHWFRRLYGVNVIGWYDPARTKQDNLDRFEQLLHDKRETEHLMVMLDLYHLPERENKFNQNPFPHYVMIDRTDNPDIWFMHDPDYRWEGPLERRAILKAIAQPSVAGGYIFDRAEARAPSRDTLQDYFLTVFDGGHNLLTDAVREIVRCHVDPSTPLALSDLDHALRELPVIAIRKYAYEHGFAFFWRELGLPEQDFEDWCDQIEALHQGFKALHYRIVKLSATQDPTQTTQVFADLDALDAQEFRIKAGLWAWFTAWQAAAEIKQPPALAKTGTV
ncbi:MULTISPECIES: DUF6005 family protein [unclassified Roseobacter]|uniref:DUF6005 family protein n=1 Tax=unclassified Roseobacter TaxID=196798 RepID=UPI0018A2F998|nr:MULTISPECIES: DUF6005 family protein [unclassified Roseobacter]MDW3183785.1 DUF6005 family protein [Roseobacter sp.]